MAKNSVSDWDTTAANNTDVGGISLEENVMKPPAVNNAFREMMAQIRTWISPLIVSRSASDAQLKLARTTSSAGESWLGANSSKLLTVLDDSLAEKFTLDRSGNIDTFGGQITFPATASLSSDANTLDDYEEGSWTPVVYGATTAGTVNYGLQRGYYTIVGRLVTFALEVTWTSHTGTGATRITLPVAPSTTNLITTALAVTARALATSASQLLGAQIAPSGGYIELTQWPIGGGEQTGVDIDTSATLRISGSYIV